MQEDKLEQLIKIVRENKRAASFAERETLFVQISLFLQ